MHVKVGNHDYNDDSENEDSEASVADGGADSSVSENEVSGDEGESARAAPPVPPAVTLTVPNFPPLGQQPSGGRGRRGRGSRGGGPPNVCAVAKYHLKPHGQEWKEDLDKVKHDVDEDVIGGAKSTLRPRLNWPHDVLEINQDIGEKSFLQYFLLMFSTQYVETIMRSTNIELNFHAHNANSIVCILWYPNYNGNKPSPRKHKG